MTGFTRVCTTISAFLLVVGLLTGCGSSAIASQPGSQTPPNGTPVPGSPTLNGCHVQPPASFTTSTPAVILTTKESQAPGGLGQGDPPSTTLHIGQVVEVQLAANVAWNLSSAGSAGLRAEAPASLYNAAGQLCLWRFTAIALGTAKLAFSGGLVCPPNSVCPAIAAIADFTIKIG